MANGLQKKKKPYLITELPEKLGELRSKATLVAVMAIEINKKNGCALNFLSIVNNAGADGCGWKHCVEREYDEWQPATEENLHHRTSRTGCRGSSMIRSRGQP